MLAHKLHAVTLENCDLTLAGVLKWACGVTEHRCTSGCICGSEWSPLGPSTLDSNAHALNFLLDDYCPHGSGEETKGQRRGVAGPVWCICQVAKLGFECVSESMSRHLPSCPRCQDSEHIQLFLWSSPSHLQGWSLGPSSFLTLLDLSESPLPPILNRG